MRISIGAFALLYFLSEVKRIASIVVLGPAIAPLPP